MNTILLFLVGLPALEIFVIIKIGQNIGAFYTISLIFITAIVGIYYARIEGLNTLRSGIYNIYKNRTPIFEIFSGASIAVAAIFLIIPGFVTDLLGFILLVPFSRKFIINFFLKKNQPVYKNKEDFIEGEITDKKNKDDKNEF
tara:strand:- start:7286 stop:7714 length:429 start_codon:yes stop_codon:yes gene_type:complete